MANVVAKAESFISGGDLYEIRRRERHHHAVVSDATGHDGVMRVSKCVLSTAKEAELSMLKIIGIAAIQPVEEDLYTSRRLAKVERALVISRTARDLYVHELEVGEEYFVEGTGLLVHGRNDGFHS